MVDTNNTDKDHIKKWSIQIIQIKMKQYKV